MYHNLIFNNVNDALPATMRLLLRKGEENGSRNGAVKELTHVGLTLARPWEREILIDYRKPNLAAQIAETMWVLTGRDDMEFLTKYLPRAADYSDDGVRWRGAYGPRLRAIGAVNEHEPIDQWAHCLDLLRRDPLTRRAVMTIYDPTIDTEDGLDIPCNNWITFSSRLGKLDMHVGVRSNDLMWGWSGINAFEWSAMLEISAALLGIQPGALHFSTTSLHLYAPHWDKGEKIADVMWPHFPDLLPSPRFEPGLRSLEWFDGIADEWFRVEAMIRERSALAADDAVLDFPEPMLRSWLRVLQWWWSGDHQYLKDLGGTRLEYATHVAMQPPSRTAPDVSAGEPGAGVQQVVGAIVQQVASGDYGPLDLSQQPQPTYEVTDAGRAALRVVPDFAEEVAALHDQKHEAYGDSWKKRGEMLGIMANIARKIDRLGSTETDDETSTDTAIDLMVYLTKYAAWLFDQRNGTQWANSTQWVNERIADTVSRIPSPKYLPGWRAQTEQRLRDMFDELETMVTHDSPEKRQCVDRMMVLATMLAKHLWEQEPAPQPPHDGDDYRGADRD